MLLAGDFLGHAFIAWMFVCGIGTWLFPDLLLTIGIGRAGVISLIVSVVVAAIRGRRQELAEYEAAVRAEQEAVLEEDEPQTVAHL